MNIRSRVTCGTRYQYKAPYNQYIRQRSRLHRWNETAYCWKVKALRARNVANFLANDIASHPTRSVVVCHANLQTTYTHH
jgi:hypothetical protein